VKVDERTIAGDADSDLRAVLVAGMLALKELEGQVARQIDERGAAEGAHAEVHPLRRAHAAVITARKELVVAEQRGGVAAAHLSAAAPRMRW
jgi:hypothetical protein